MPSAMPLAKIDSEFAFNNLKMKRDFDLFRSLLLCVEQFTPGKPIQGLTPKNLETEVISEHVKLLIDEHFLEGEASRSSNKVHYVVHGLTWKGHDFLNNARNDTVWKKVMADAENKGMSLSMSVLNGLLTKAAQKYIGLA